MSQTHNQLVASHEQMDLDEAQERVQRILRGEAGPTLTPQPQAPAGLSSVAPRKKRSDAGVPKKAPADPDEIVLRLTLDEARKTALGMPDFATSMKIQDQIVACLQKRLDALSRSK